MPAILPAPAQKRRDTNIGALQAKGDLDGALGAYTELSNRWRAYGDVGRGGVRAARPGSLPRRARPPPGGRGEPLGAARDLRKARLCRSSAPPTGGTTSDSAASAVLIVRPTP